MWADQEEASDLGSRKTGPVSESKKAGRDALHRSAEEQRVRRDDGGDVGAGEADAGEQGDDGIGVGGRVEAGIGELIQ